MKIHQLSAGDAVASLNSSPKGLSPGEAQRRLVEYGPNRVEEIHRESPVLRFVKEFVHFFALILWLAAALAFLAEWIDPGQGMAKIAGKPPYQALTLFARAGSTATTGISRTRLWLACLGRFTVTNLQHNCL